MKEEEEKYRLIHPNAIQVRWRKAEVTEYLFSCSTQENPKTLENEERKKYKFSHPTQEYPFSFPTQENHETQEKEEEKKEKYPFKGFRCQNGTHPLSLCDLIYISFPLWELC